MPKVEIPKVERPKVEINQREKMKAEWEGSWEVEKPM
jgi:hypothetical protein